MPVADKMEAKYIFWFTFLVLQALQVSCEQKTSLTFVIDNSMSMHDDIEYVRQAAKSIMDIVLNEKSSLIEDIVLVTFNDPDWTFVKRTSSEAELKTALDNIKLVGNRDCPEMSLSGIKLGLEESLPGSFLYVFTDASAKDHHKYEEIINLCQEKHIQIVFVLTGTCPEDKNNPNQAEVYHKIATASNGQVFSVDKENVGEILNYIQETIKGDKSVLTSTSVPSTKDSDSYVYFNIDDKTEYALVSTSGSDVSLKVQKETETSNTYNDISGEKVTWTKNAKVLKLANITPGRYRAAVRGSSDVNVMVFGRTDFNFDLGFSNKPESSLKTTETQPTIGAETHLIIAVKDDDNSVNIKNVELLDMKEKVIKTLPLSNVGGNVYTTEKFLPPNDMFKVAVNAVAIKSEKPIQRIAKTPVQPIQPTVVAPEIADTEKNIKASEGSPVNIQCRIRNGKPKPQVTWYFKPRGAAEFSLMKDKTDEVLRLSSAAERDAGEYKCAAENSAGSKEHITQLEVDAVPAFVESPSVLYPTVSSNVDIPCKISKGSPLPTITWQFKSTDGAEYQNKDNTGEHFKIVNVQPGDSGFYKCRAQNAVGSAEQVIEVIVSVAPEITDTEKNVKATEGSPVKIHCRIQKGKPKPQVTWYFKPRGATEFTLMKDKTDEVLRLSSAAERDAGEYKCAAENSAGSKEHITQLEVDAVPALVESPPVLYPTVSSNVEIPCKISKGSPLPTITWQFKSTDGAEYQNKDNTGEHFKIVNVQPGDSGFYKCQAKNAVGSAEQVIEVIVSVAPEITDTEKNVKATEGSPVKIHCRIQKGKPKPQVTWYFKPRGATEFALMKDETDEVLRVRSAAARDAGEYKCVAENSAGRKEQVTQLEVDVPPKVEKENVKTKVIGSEGSDVSLNCGQIVGNPPHTIKWTFREPGSSKTQDLEAVTGSKSIKINSAKLAYSGVYTCIVENDSGRHEHAIDVTIQAASKPNGTPENITADENSSVHIYCNVANGSQQPTVTWFFKANNANNYEKLTANTATLELTNVQGHDCGHYRCEVESTAGPATQDVELIVKVTSVCPEFENTPATIKQQENTPVTIDCRLRKGNPRPKITWLFREVCSPTFTTLDYTGEEMKLPSAQLKESGEYKCVAENSAGRDEKTTLVTVLAPPRIEKTDSRCLYYQGVEGDVVMKVPCIAVGSPKPNVTWVVDHTVVGNDKTQTMYVEDGVLYLNNPDGAQSSNRAHSYMCHAVNEFGKDEQCYEVIISEYADYDKPETKYINNAKPYAFKCPLPYTEPNSVRWFVNTTPTGKTGPSLQFNNPKQADNGNYTCRVSDLAGAASYTEELKFGSWLI